MATASAAAPTRAAPFASSPRRRRCDALRRDHRRRRRGISGGVVVASGGDGGEKLYVPGDAMGGDNSPERAGAATMRRLFTHVAIRIVQGQLEGLGNDGGFAPQATGWDGTVQCPDYADLRHAMEHVPLGNGDEWISGAFYSHWSPYDRVRRGERRSLRTFPGASLRPGSLGFNPRPRRLSTPLLTPLNSTPISSLCMEWPSSAFMKKNPVVALRVLETRKAYCAQFDYRELKRCADELVLGGNVLLMKEHMEISMGGGGGGGGE